MKEGYIAVGMLLMVLGFALFIICYNVVKEYQSFSGQLARAILPSEERTYRLYVLGEIASGVIAILGLTFLIYGAAVKGRQD